MLIVSCSLQRWTRDKMLSFVPPDGKFKLMDYRYTPATASAVSQTAVPFALRTGVTIDEQVDIWVRPLVAIRFIGNS